MASSIKVRDETKTKLEKLQANILLNLGRKISQQDLIELMVDFAERDPNKLFRETIITKEKVDQLLSLSKPWKIETNPDMLDDIIAGDI